MLQADVYTCHPTAQETCNDGGTCAIADKRREHASIFVRFAINIGTYADEDDYEHH